MMLRRDQFPFCKLRCKLLERSLYPASVHNKFLKKYLIYTLGEKCARCGWSERHPKTGKVPTSLCFARTVIHLRTHIAHLIVETDEPLALVDVKTHCAEWERRGRRGTVGRRRFHCQGHSLRPWNQTSRRCCRFYNAGVAQRQQPQFCKLAIVGSSPTAGSTTSNRITCHILS